jgi:hypothetical protein
MRVTSKGQVTIPVDIRTRFGSSPTPRWNSSSRNAVSHLTTDEILAPTREP